MTIHICIIIKALLPVCMKYTAEMRVKWQIRIVRGKAG